MIDKNRMSRLAEQFGIELSETQLNQLSIYAQMLVSTNEKLNLTSITQPQEIEIKHFLDCLLAAECSFLGESFVDVGSGAGFPGMVVKIFRPQLSVTLMEPTGKRLSFLREVSEAIGVEVSLVKERAEEAARKEWREAFDSATARAVAALPALCEYCLPLVRKGGHFIAMKTEPQEQIRQAQKAIAKLGGEVKEVKSYSLPGEIQRSLIVIQKVEHTPPQYPRAGGVIAKRPL